MRSFRTTWRIVLLITSICALLSAVAWIGILVSHHKESHELHLKTAELLDHAVSEAKAEACKVIHARFLTAARDNPTFKRFLENGENAPSRSSDFIGDHGSGRAETLKGIMNDPESVWYINLYTPPSTADFSRTIPTPTEICVSIEIRCASKRFSTQGPIIRTVLRTARENEVFIKPLKLKLDAAGLRYAQSE